MAEMARTPSPSWDKHSRRYIINWRFPKHLHAVIGATAFRDNFPRTIARGSKEAAERGVEKLAEFYAIRDAAEQALATPGGHLEAVRNTVGPRLFAIGDNIVNAHMALDAADAALAARRKEIQFHKMARELGATIERLPSTKFVETEAVIDAWLVERRDVLKRVPKPKAIERKRQVIRDMLAATGRPHFGAVTEGDLRTYHGKLGGEAYDHLSELRPLFRRAKAINLIEVNPFLTAIDKMPPKVRGRRSMFLDDVAATILAAALASSDPVIKYANVIAAYTGAINSEILEADASEFFQDSEGRWVWDMRDRVLKTAFRPRVLPLHKVIRESGFLEYLATRAGCGASGSATGGASEPLFDGSPSWNSNRLNLWLKKYSPGSFYWWRHRVIHNLNNLIKVGKTTESLNQFIQGHEGSTIARRHYHHHELPSEFPAIVTAIEALE